MDLSELEVAAASLLAEQERIEAIDAELAMLKQEIKDLPRRAEKDRSFYALIGLNYTDPGHENRRADLEKEREGVASRIAEARKKIVGALTSRTLVVPLDPTPGMEGSAYVFRFRSGAAYPKSVEALGEMLGIPTPLKLGEVTVYPEKVVVNEVDPYFAKERIVDAFDNVGKTVSLRLAKDAAE
jgi:hypothetical protein